MGKLQGSGDRSQGLGDRSQGLGKLSTSFLGSPNQTDSCYKVKIKDEGEESACSSYENGIFSFRPFPVPHSNP